LCYRGASKRKSDLLVRKFIFNYSKSSSPKISHDNGHILGAAKAANIFYAEQEA
jgi:hypothetical protein